MFQTKDTSAFRLGLCRWFYVLVLFFILLASGDLEGQFIRGDVLVDGAVNTGDLIFLANVLVGIPGGAIAAPLDRADINDNEYVNFTDYRRLAGSLFCAGGPTIPAPFPATGFDPDDGNDTFAGVTAGLSLYFIPVSHAAGSITYAVIADSTIAAVSVEFVVDVGSSTPSFAMAAVPPSTPGSISGSITLVDGTLFFVRIGSSGPCLSEVVIAPGTGVAVGTLTLTCPAIGAWVLDWLPEAPVAGLLRRATFATAAFLDYHPAGVIAPLGATFDCNSDGIPDACQSGDCDGDGILDVTEICLGAADCNSDGIPDECQSADCDGDGTLDLAEICAGALDCNGDLIPDDCPGSDCDCDGVTDLIEIACLGELDADGDGIPDACDPVPPPALDPNPVAFSVRGNVSSLWVGIVEAPGAPLSSYLRGLTTPLHPQAVGRPTPRVGDVNDYLTFGLPSEAELFQSEPDAPVAGPPAETNNQVLTADGLGLVAGIDNVDAISWCNDYFGVGVGIPGLPWPPASLPTFDLPWEARLPYGAFGVEFARPTIEFDLGTSFRLSWDSFSIGLSGTALAVESGASDVGALLGPWQSPACLSPTGPSADGAGGDVFATDVLANPPTGSPSNTLADDERALGLRGRGLTVEDDIDALERVGFNCVPWDCSGAILEAGNLHARLIDLFLGLGLAPPSVRNHVTSSFPLTVLTAPFTYGSDPADPMPGDPIALAPVLFSVDRASSGRWDSAVRTQWWRGSDPTGLFPPPPVVPAIEQAGDVFITLTYTDSVTGEIVSSNMLFIDNEQLGLMPQDDLDALIVMASDVMKYHIRPCMANAMSGRTLTNGDGSVDEDGMPDDEGDHYEGLGYTKSLTYDFASQIDGSFVKVGFSVTSDSIGRFQTAVDYEARGLGENAGYLQQCGDIYYSEANPLTNTNFLWYEETGVGGSAGSWAFTGAPSYDLAARPDELDGLDSIDGPVPPFGPSFERGDANSDGAFNIGDAVSTLGYLFASGALAPTCFDAADSNDDGAINIGDAIRSLSALFIAGSPPPPAPYPGCGVDPSADSLDCVGPILGCP
ncbi:MAG: hypothetical protein ACKVX7_04145 [Planctomycetota bacterium]